MKVEICPRGLMACPSKLWCLGFCEHHAGCKVAWAFRKRIRTNIKRRVKK